MVSTRRIIQISRGRDDLQTERIDGVGQLAAPQNSRVRCVIPPSGLSLNRRAVGLGAREIFGMQMNVLNYLLVIRFGEGDQSAPVGVSADWSRGFPLLKGKFRELC